MSLIETAKDYERNDLLMSSMPNYIRGMLVCQYYAEAPEEVGELFSEYLSQEEVKKFMQLMAENDTAAIHHLHCAIGSTPRATDLLDKVQAKAKDALIPVQGDDEYDLDSDLYHEKRDR